jgi:hypothetical protein
LLPQKKHAPHKWIIPHLQHLATLIIFHFFFFLAVLGLELRASCLLEGSSTTWPTPPALFCVGYFWDPVSQIICPGLSHTRIFLISASCVARITGLSLQHIAPLINFQCAQISSLLKFLIYRIIQCLVCWNWVISLTVMFVSFVHVLIWINISLFFLIVVLGTDTL